MFKKLQQKWGVSGTAFVLVLCTFAIGGSACGKLGKLILDELAMERGVAYWVLYFVIVTLLWPLSVLTVSIPLGQFQFFKNYLHRVLLKLTGKKS